MAGKAWSEERRANYKSGGYDNLRARNAEDIRNRCLGKKLDQTTKDKMSEAKVGVAKSEEHKASMREVHLKRGALLKAIKEELPNLDKFMVAKKIKEELGRYPELKEINLVLSPYKESYILLELKRGI